MDFLDLRIVRTTWNAFFFSEENVWIGGALRVGLAFLFLVNTVVLFLDAEMWFTQVGLLPYEASRGVVDPDTWSAFGLFENSIVNVRIYLSVLMASMFFMLVGLYGRIQAAIIFVLMTSLQHRNVLIVDGEDNLMRLLCFLFIFLPLDNRFSIRSWWRKKRQHAADFPQTFTAWPLRLVQLQMTLLYVSTAWLKLDGEAWLEGSALYYTTRLDDLFGNFPVPGFVLESMFVLQWSTWLVLAIEVFLPVGLWIRQTRRFSLVLAFLFHLSIEYSMNLFLFHWVMMVGLMAFVRTDDLKAWGWKKD